MVLNSIFHSESPKGAHSNGVDVGGWVGTHTLFPCTLVPVSHWQFTVVNEIFKETQQKTKKQETTLTKKASLLKMRFKPQN